MMVSTGVSMLLAEVAEESVIPKIIHQTYGRPDLPAALQQNIAELKSRNPTWEHRFYDDDAIEAFITAEYGKEVLSIYRRINPIYGAARADLFRYLVVYRNGGIYLDIKSRFLCPIDEVIRGDEAFIVSQWSNSTGDKYEGFGLKPEVAHVAGGEFQQWHVIAAPGHPFLRAVLLAIFDGIARYRPWRDGTGKVGVIRLTGPIAYTLTIAPLIGQYRCKVIKDESVLQLDYSIAQGNAHKNFFKTHYTSVEAAIVRPANALGLANLAYQLSRYLKKGSMRGLAGFRNLVWAKSNES